MATLLILAGPKGVGKSWVARIAEREFGVHYVDADLLILDLLARGEAPDPVDGWLVPVEGAVVDALRTHDRAVVEITGAWDSDCSLARHIEQQGHRVVRLLITAPLEETLARLQARTTRKVPVTEQEATATYHQAAARWPHEPWDAFLDTSGEERPKVVTETLGRLLHPF